MLTGKSKGNNFRALLRVILTWLERWSQTGILSRTQVQSIARLADPTKSIGSERRTKTATEFIYCRIYADVILNHMTGYVGMPETFIFSMRRSKILICDPVGNQRLACGHRHGRIFVQSGCARLSGCTFRSVLLQRQGPVRHGVRKRWRLRGANIFPSLFDSAEFFCASIRLPER